MSSSGLIHFDVGVVDKQFSLSLFESPPDCTAADPVDHSFELNGASVDLNVAISMVRFSYCFRSFIIYIYLFRIRVDGAKVVTMMLAYVFG